MVLSCRFLVAPKAGIQLCVPCDSTGLWEIYDYSIGLTPRAEYDIDEEYFSAITAETAEA